ncbi:MAG TPA: hypothetical protein VEW28_05255 [Candidatus Kapabacteria bacterium]|nr:hypothetical protein [Candidatus Kapabacteria bacterium]
MVKPRSTYLLFLIFLLPPLLCGCPYNPIPPGSDIIFWGWKPDGSGIVAVRWTDSYPQRGREVVAFNLQGQELSSVRLEKAISYNEFSDKLYFVSDGERFLAQIDTDIFIVDPLTGTESLVVSGQKFIAASPSGKLIFTWQYHTSDSIQYAIISLNGNIQRRVANWGMPVSGSFAPYFGPSGLSFINDSLFIACFSDTGICSLTLFDTLFTIKYSANDREGYTVSAFAQQANQLVYLSSSGFSIFDVPSRTIIRHIQSAPSAVLSLDVSPTGGFFVYNVSDNGRFFFDPSSIMLFNLKTNQETKLESGIASSGQLSPDGKLLGFFTRSDDRGKLNIIPVP